MSLGGPSTPAAPTAPIGSFIDPFALANVQQTYNVGSGVANQAGSFPTYTTPTYSQGYSQIGTGPGGVPLYGMTQTLTPQEQANLDQYLGMQNWAGQQVPGIYGNAQNMLGFGLDQLQQAGQYFPQGASNINTGMNTIGQWAMPTMAASSAYRDAATAAASQAENVYGQGAFNAFNQAQNQYFPEANSAYNLAQNSYLPAASNAFNQATGTINQRAMPSTGRAAGDVGLSDLNLLRFGAQDPSQIGDMASGLTGQRMDAAVAGIAPFQKTQRDQLDNQLRNQGLQPGEPGYDNAMRELDNSQNMAISSFEAQFQPQAWQQATQLYQDPLAKASAFLQGAQGNLGVGGQYGQLAGQQAGIGQGFTGLGSAQTGVGQGFTGLGNAQTNVGQGLTGLMGTQNQVANTFTGLSNAQIAAGQGMLGAGQGQMSGGSQLGALGTAQGNLGNIYGNLGTTLQAQALPYLAASSPMLPGPPQFPGLNIAPTNVAALGSNYNNTLSGNYANQLGAYNAQLQQNNNMLSGLFGIGSSVLGGLAAGGIFSERAFKENIEPLGTLPNGIPVYRFNYKWGGPTMIGPMADEVQKIMPEAVMTVDGIRLVNYSMIMR